MKAFVAAVLGLAALLAPLSPAAALTPPRLIFQAPPAFQSTAARLEAAVTPQLGSVMRLAGLEEGGPPVRVVLAPEGSPEAGWCPAGWWATPVGNRSLIVLLPQRVPRYPDSSLDDVLLHEAAHVLVARAAGGSRCPAGSRRGWR